MRLEAHRHDWPCLALPLLGRYREINEAGEAIVDGPAAVLHGAGSEHAEVFGDTGAEVLILTFDPAWLSPAGERRRIEGARSWTAGAIAACGRGLADAWLCPRQGEADLARLTADFIRNALSAGPEPAPPAWLGEVERALGNEGSNRSPAIAGRLDLHRAWVARAFRAARGEGLREAVRRKRVERALPLLRRTDLPLAEVAAEAGFCDQSHMNRAVRALTGRTPTEIRREGRPVPLAPVP
jgi:AraC family transcriptional regulator